MTTSRKNKESGFKTEIGLPEGKEWSESHLENIKKFIDEESQNRSAQQQLNIKLQGVRYKMEEYLENTGIDIHHIFSVRNFLDDYLKVLNLSFKTFAVNIDTTDGNLKKYLSGERKFNTDLAMKFGCFFHTSPDLWFHVYTKNELLILKNEKDRIDKYQKYDYKKAINSIGA